MRADTISSAPAAQQQGADKNAPPTLGRKLLWFCTIWAASVLSLAVLSALLRWWLL